MIRETFRAPLPGMPLFVMGLQGIESLERTSPTFFGA